MEQKKKQNTLGRVGKLFVLNKFQELGLNFQCNVEKDYPHDFDFLVNGYRVEVKMSSQNFSQKNLKYKYGRWIFNYTKEKDKFDILVCIGQIKNKIIFLIIPKEKIKGQKAIAVYPLSDTKNWRYYSQFINKWDYLKK